MYKLPVLREDRRLLRDHRRTPEDAQALSIKVVKKACRALRERCQSLRSVALEQLESITTARYQYRPLNRSRQEIRLLILEPSSGNSTLRCTLEHKFLDVKPPPSFETISYVCGDPSKKKTIFLNGHGIRAMATSEAALRRMRLRDEPRTLWIDSICIDQNNTDERGQQVGMMYQIYSLTFRNLIWLGPYDDIIAEAVTAMNAILQEIAIETRDYADFEELVMDHNQVYRWSQIPLSSTTDGLAFLRILDIPWFSRLWIVQEASLAPSSVCHYSELELPLISILRSARWLYYKWYKLPRASEPAHQCLGTTASMFDLVDRKYGVLRTTAHLMSMANLLRNLRTLQTFDRRDKVYALIGLWQMLTKTATLPDVLRPDYNLGVCEVFVAGVRFAIKEIKSLGMLENICQPSREAQWPSWLPVIDRDPYGKDEPYPMTGEPFDVDNMVRMILKKDPQKPNDLIVSGVLLDIIVQVTPAIASDTRVRRFQALVAHLEHLECDETRISLILLAGSVRGTRIAPEQALQCYRDFKAYLNGNAFFPPKLQDLAPSASDEDRSASGYWEEANERCAYRRVFHTAHGLPGLGPQCTQPGDVVTILYGCRLPMVLRPLPGLPKGSYQLLGASYVYGIMDGEAVRRHKEMGLEDDVFRIV
jgi:hypothetical protein